MRAWGVLRQLLAVMLCALLVAPAYSYEKAPSTIQPHDQANGGVYPKTRVWGSEQKILLHIRAVGQLSEKERWGWAKCSEENVVGSGVSYDYDAFGNLLHSTGNTPNNYLFAGEQFDSDLGLYYNRARYLNISTGRFWSMDTFEGNSQDPLSLHKYLYAGNDPVNRIDPSGRDFDVISTVGALAVQYPLVTMTVVSVGIGGAGGCIAGALDSRSTCSQGFYSGLLAGAVFGAIGGVGGPVVRVVLGVAFSGWAGVSAYSAAKRHDYALAAFDVVAALGSAFLTGRLAYSTWGPSASLPPPTSTQPLPPGWNSNWTQMNGTRGGFNWFDEAGGEWRWHEVDAYHPDAHWDYNPWTDWNSPWQNVPAGGPAPAPSAPASGNP